MIIERRAFQVEVRAPDDATRTFEAVVLNYGVLDSYDTIFDAGCFTKSLEARLPRITWAHDWSEPLGRYVDYKDTETSLTLVGEFDDFDAVPRARQAYAQLKSGTIDNFSVGFSRIASREDDEHRTHFTEAELDEAALVLRGAVPGTKLVSVRSQSGLSVVRQVPVDLVVELGKKIAAGEMSHDEAEAALSLASGDKPVEPTAPVVDLEAVAQADADALEALDAIGAG